MSDPADLLHTSPEDDQANDPAYDALLAGLERRRRRVNVGLLLAALAALLALGAWLIRGPLDRPIRKLLYTPEAVRTAPETLLERVHARLLPSWVIARSQAHLKGGLEAEAEAFATLRAALDGQPPLQKILDDLRALTADPARLPERAEALREAVGMWNAAMQQAGKPWWIEGGVLSSPRRAFFYLKSYRVLADTRTQVGDATHRARFVARVDRTNVVESMLGHASPHQDGAIILVDRLHDLALDEIWPLLDPTTPDPQGARAALLAALPPTAAATLQATAPHRRALVKTTRAIAARRACGSTFRMARLPWQGFPIEEEALLESYARKYAAQRSECPGITHEEVAALVKASNALRDAPELRRAVEALVAQLARPIAIHEARHVADHAQADGLQTPLACAACDAARLSVRARAELSAYLASFAAPSTSATALFQACTLNLNRGTPHAAALRFALPRLGMPERCASPPPADLPARARDLERALFGRSDTITLPEDFPAHLWLWAS